MHSCFRFTIFPSKDELKLKASSKRYWVVIELVSYNLKTTDLEGTKVDETWLVEGSPSLQTAGRGDTREKEIQSKSR